MCISTAAVVSKSLLQEAVRNNADWCERVASSHSVLSVWRGDAWTTSGDMPPFYPNVVTLKKGISLDRAAEIAEELPENCGWKDSFADLDLSAFGFKVGIEAHWYGLSERAAAPESVSVCEVTTTEGLESWIAAWGATPNGATIFRSEIVQQNVRFLYRMTASEIDAGLIANIDSGVVGISNAFGSSDGVVQCIDAAMKIGNGRSIVGYGSEEELGSLMKLGFVGLGKLRIWLR